jgi:pimeloyl-ACP methyl ester carboxylesterase
MPKRLPRARTLKGDPKLAYYDSAGGVAGEPAIVLLHASLARSEDWENIFPRLATRYRTIAYDARGHGKSGRATSYTLRDFTGDTLRVVREVARAPVVLLGHSLGALCALVTAGEEPNLVRGFVLEDPPLAYGRAWEAPKYQALRDALGSADAVALQKAVAKQPLPSPGPRGERTYGELRGFYAAERVVSYFRDVDPAFIDSRTSGDDATASLALDAIAKVRCPSLVLAGEPRLGGAMDDASEWKLRKLPETTIKRFPGSGHLLHGFRPEQFIENLEPFLRKIRES